MITTSTPVASAAALIALSLASHCLRGHQHLVPLLLADVHDVAAGAVRRVLVLEVHAAGADPDQLGRQGEGLGRAAEAGLHVHEGRRGVEQLLALAVVPVGVPGALDALPHLEDELDHLVRLVDADVRVHALGGRELPAAAVERLEPEPGHDRRGEGVVGAGGVEEAALVPGLVEEPAELVGRDLALRRGEEPAHRLGGVGGLGGHRVESQSP